MKLDNLEDKANTNKTTWGGARQGGGRPMGSKNKSTIEQNLIRDEFKSRILENIQELLTSQLIVAKGANYLYRIDEEKNSKGRVISKKHVIVTCPIEIQNVLDECEGTGDFEDNYYYITTKTPDTKALDSLMDRVFGKSTSSLDIKSEVRLELGEDRVNEIRDALRG